MILGLSVGFFSVGGRFGFEKVWRKDFLGFLWSYWVYVQKKKIMIGWNNQFKNMLCEKNVVVGFLIKFMVF